MSRNCPTVQISQLCCTAIVDCSRRPSTGHMNNRSSSTLRRLLRGPAPIHQSPARDSPKISARAIAESGFLLARVVDVNRRRRQQRSLSARAPKKVRISRSLETAAAAAAAAAGKKRRIPGMFLLSGRASSIRLPQPGHLVYTYSRRRLLLFILRPSSTFFSRVPPRLRR